MSGYTSYGSEGRYSGKFRVMQQRGLSSLLSLFLSRIVSFSLASFLRLSFSSPFLSLCFGSVRQGCSFRFVSFFVSKDKPMVRSRRSRRPTAYTRTRQLLRTTRHIVSDSPPLFTTVPLSLSLSLSFDLRSAPRCNPNARRRFPSSDKLCISKGALSRVLVYVRIAGINREWCR